MQEDPKFGTDGVRGVANDDLSAYFAFRLGRAAGALLAREVAKGRPMVHLGRDPRISGPMLQSALTAGLLSVGADVIDLGILPTPGVALLTRTSHAAAGAMISASHNPARDNGIKFFGPDGRKIADAFETQIEETLDSWETLPFPTGGDVGHATDGAALVEEYVHFLIHAAPCRLDGLRIVMDGGNGAASFLGPRVAHELGASVTVLSCEPDGVNINDDCGAMHPERARAVATAAGADLAISFDGDADRAIFGDARGELVDGDRVMAMCALAWRGTDRLPGDQVVGTVMSNVGLERGLADNGVRLLRAPVGDRHVSDMMRETGAGLGGEKSGHIIFANHHTTGDGLLTFLQIAGLMMQSGKSLSELAGQIQEYPQLLINVPVWRRRGWRDQPDLWAAVRRAEAQLGSRGRMLVRASGTERLIRVMAEGPDEREVHALVHDVAETIKRTMGPPPDGGTDEEEPMND